MVDVLLAGPYPAGTLEKLQKAVEGTDISIRAVLTEEEFAKENDVDAIILRIIKMPKEVIQRFSPKLKMIMRWGVGYDAVDVQQARVQDIDVCNTPGANAYAVSELAVLLMLAVGRCLLCHSLELRKGVWSREIFTSQSRSLNHKVVGLVGGGNIGRQVARKVINGKGAYLFPGFIDFHTHLFQHGSGFGLDANQLLTAGIKLIANRGCCMGWQLAQIDFVRPVTVDQ